MAINNRIMKLASLTIEHTHWLKPIGAKNIPATVWDFGHEETAGGTRIEVCEASASARDRIARVLCNPRTETISTRNKAFIREGSSRTTSRSGQRIATGMPGKPAPEPRSRKAP